MNCDLPDQTSSVAKTINSNAMRLTGFTIRAIAEHSGAKQRRNIDIVIFGRQTKTKSCVGNGELGVTAVDVVAGEAGVVAKILSGRSTINGFAIRPAQPRNPDAVTDRKIFDALASLLDAPDNLMSQNQRQLRVGQLAINNVQIGPANGAGVNPDKQLACLPLWFRHIVQHERFSRFLQNHRAHVDLITWS